MFRRLISKHGRTWPVLTLALGLGAALAALLPSGGLPWIFDREAVAGGELWRIVTCHFIHVNGSHLFLDLIVFLVLGSILEVRLRKAYLISLLAGGIVIPLGVYILLPGLRYYCGLSGLDTAAYTLLAVHLLKTGWQQKKTMPGLIMLTALAGLLFKIAYEIHTGRTLFAVPGTSGLIIAWYREKLGGIITITCLLLFYAVHLAESGNLPNGPWFSLIAAPGLLFLISTLRNDKNSAHQRRNSVSNCS